MRILANETVRLFKSYSDTTLLDDLTDRWMDGGHLRWATSLHGGFGILSTSFHVTLTEAWLYLSRGDVLPGRHFAHIEVRDHARLLYEGRVMTPSLTGVGEERLMMTLTAMGYHSSLNDKRVTTLSYSSTTVDAIIKAILTAKCPSINSDQSYIETVPGTISLTLSADRYPMGVILDDLAPLGDEDGETYYWAVWGDRKPYYTKRALSAIDWDIPLSHLGQWSLRQTANLFRPTADAFDGTTRTDAASSADAISLYGVDRDAVVSVPSGTTAGRAEDARDRFLTDYSKMQQDSSFTLVKPPIPRAKLDQVHPSISHIRAGDVIRLTDLAPASVTSPYQDNIRTFFVMETQYDAGRNEMTLVPDRPMTRLDTMLARMGIAEV